MLAARRAGTSRSLGGVWLLGLALVLWNSLPAAAQERAVPQSAAEITLSFAPVVKTVAPAVVNVYASRTVVQQPVSPFFDDPFFRRFFGGPGPDFGRPRERVQSSLGSGVIISADGTIVTNNHVIKDADQVRVALADRREFDADIVLKDERTDLAVLKIREPGSYPSVEFADSDGLEVGDIVLAIGNPFGVGQTVTQGIVSALARTRVGVTDYQFFIQTDAAINPGNSGGALVDMKGHLVGINTAIFSRSGGSNGIGFAIPSNMVRFVATAATDGKVQRPWLGASVQTVGAEIAEALGLDRPRGVLLTQIHPESPARDAGLKIGDLVTAIDGAEVLDPDSFGYRFGTKAIGGRATFTFLRGGKELTAEVVLMAAPESVPRDVRVIRTYSPFEGATVMNLSPAVAEELGLGLLEEGVVIAEIAPGSPAAQVGLQAGDVVVSVNEEAVDSTRRLERLARDRPRLWRLEIRRGGETSRIVLRG
ncbi:DegQ family serine endoprotease [Polymorphum gilvum]|uniref:Trypsin-like serine protease n=1 Tax=Polymorphum gilvum (strain LMG 25793 / CGMCC 1.9160 / SL003B-26A1) TaxID=991905 RepID=F2IUW4_POLGS|nr:DegQ family serine endoprotease [Polymorphum gilvum]ADZ70193.1 Trypsin-like serine protease [Polymorphum gilvum SL003B-26A1]